MTDVIALLQRLSSNKAAGTSSHALVPPVDNHSIHAEVYLLCWCQVFVSGTTETPPTQRKFTQDAAGLSFEELERRRQFGARLPPPPPRPQQHTPLPPPPASMAKPEQLPPPPPKRANKNRPIEQSSKKAVPRFRDVLQVGNKAAVDPRFASGGLEEPAAKTSDKELWRKRYAFVFDELLPEEKQEAQRALTVGVCVGCLLHGGDVCCRGAMYVERRKPHEKG